MVRTYLGSKGYTLQKEDFTPDQITKIQEDLYFTPYAPEGYGAPPEPFSVFEQSETEIYVPKFYGIETFGEPQENKLPEGKNVNLRFQGDLRPDQLQPVEICLQAKKSSGGGILCLGCGAGKTVMGLYLLSQIQKKALIVVHKEFLLDQWVERIKMFLPQARVGTIQGKVMDVENKDIVIGMLQSLSMKDYAPAIFAEFGVAIFDEVHCIPCKVFSKALQKIQTRYHFGLSATPNRTDGMTKLTKLFIGPILNKKESAKKRVKNPKNLRVLRVMPDKIPSTSSYVPRVNYNGKPDVVKMLNKLIECPMRRDVLGALLLLLAWKDERKILVLSNRKKYLKDLEERVMKEQRDVEEKRGEKLGVVVKYYVGGMKKKERKDSEENATILLATYEMAKEAMDIPYLDTLIMANSKGEIEQAVGRVMRRKEYPIERPPLVIDYVDQFSSFAKQAEKRMAFYKKHHYPVKDMIFPVKEIGKVESVFLTSLQELVYQEPSCVEEEEKTVDLPRMETFFPVVPKEQVNDLLKDLGNSVFL